MKSTRFSGAAATARRWCIAGAAILLLGGSAACGDDEPAFEGLCAEQEAATECTTVLAPSDDDATALRTALIETQSGSTVCLCPGTYKLEKDVSLKVRDVTVKGIGASREDVVLDFATQTEGDDGFTVTSDKFTIEHLWVKNSPGNGIVVSGAEDVVFRDLKVSWDAGSVTENGAYAVYPIRCKRVLVEDTEIIGAADAGIYVGQSEQALVRNNKVHGNVAGIEIENTTDSEVVGNETYDNAAGILVFVLPDLEKKDGFRCKVHNNDVHDNNRANFAENGTIVAAVPPGTGMLLLAADDTEVTGNTIRDNDTTGILAVSYQTLGILIGGGADPLTDQYLTGLYVHGNTFSGNGTNPREIMAALATNPLEDIVWDGVEESAGSGNVCLSSSPSSFRNFNTADNIDKPANHLTDTTPHECSGTVQSTIDL